MASFIRSSQRFRKKALRFAVSISFLLFLVEISGARADDCDLLPVAREFCELALPEKAISAWMGLRMAHGSNARPPLRHPLTKPELDDLAKIWDGRIERTKVWSQQTFSRLKACYPEAAGRSKVKRVVEFAMALGRERFQMIHGASYDEAASTANGEADARPIYKWLMSMGEADLGCDTAITRQTLPTD